MLFRLTAALALVGSFAAAFFLIDPKAQRVLYMDMSFTELQVFESTKVPRVSKARLRGKNRNRDLVVSVSNPTLADWGGFVLEPKTKPYPFSVPSVAIPDKSAIAKAYRLLGEQAEYLTDVSFKTNKVNLVINGDEKGPHLVFRSPFHSQQGTVHKKSSLFQLKAGTKSLQKWAASAHKFPDEPPAADVVAGFLTQNSALHLMVLLDKIQSELPVVASLVLHNGGELRVDSVIFESNQVGKGSFLQTLNAIFGMQADVFKKYKIHKMVLEETPDAG